VNCSLRVFFLDEQQRWIFQQVPQFFQLLRIQSAVDDAMVAAHRDRHAMADYDLVARPISGIL